MSDIRVRTDVGEPGRGSWTDAAGGPDGRVHVTPFTPGLQLGNTPVYADLLWGLAANGQIFFGADADQNDALTGQTAFANTASTLAIDVPAGVTCLPLALNLTQTGTVAGGEISVYIEIDDVKRFSSGTAETVFNPARSKAVMRRCGLYSTVTLAAGYGIRVYGRDIAQDVDPGPTEGAVQSVNWRPTVPILLEGPASFIVYTSAATTGPTWYWDIAWAEWTTADLQ